MALSYRITGKPEVGRFHSAVASPFDHLGISDGRIQANNMGVVLHP